MVGELSTTKSASACGNVFAAFSTQIDCVFRRFRSTDEEAPLVSSTAAAENEESVFVSGTAKERLSPHNSHAPARPACFYQLEINKIIKV